MKSNKSKCLWTACIAAVAVCMTMSAAYGTDLGTGSVTSVNGVGSSCVLQGGSSVEHWDVEAGGTYDVTISGVTECDGPSIEVIVKSSDNGNQTLAAYANPNVPR